jgi:hypothetical protein
LTREQRSEDEGQWIIEPPEPNEVQLQIVIGEGIEVTDEARRALDALLTVLHTGDVAGYKGSCYPRCPDLETCGLACYPYHNCTVLKSQPTCVINMNCRIKD